MVNSSAVESTEAAPGKTAGKEVTVLFCSHDFDRGFQYSKEACEALENVKVTRCQRNEISKFIGIADVLVPMMVRLDKTLIQRAKKARMILQFGVGLEGVDIKAATERGIQVSNIPSGACGNALSCAEMAIYLSLCCLRQAKELATSVQNRALGVPIGDTLHGKTCLMVGFGNIAKELAPRLKALGVRLIGVRQSSWATAEANQPLDTLFAERVQWQQLYEAAAKADMVMLTCTATEATRGMVNDGFLGACRPGIIIINVARGALLDYEATKRNLENGKIGALGLDVQWQEPFDPEDPIAKHPRVHLTPHVAGVTELSYRGMAKCVAQEAARFRDGLPATVQINDITRRS